MPKTPPPTPHSGRPPRLNARRVSVLIDLTTIAILKKIGNGKLGPGIDKAAHLLEKLDHLEERIQRLEKGVK